MKKRRDKKRRRMIVGISSGFLFVVLFLACIPLSYRDCLLFGMGGFFSITADCFWAIYYDKKSGTAPSEEVQ